MFLFISLFVARVVFSNGISVVSPIDDVIWDLADSDNEVIIRFDIFNGTFPFSVGIPNMSPGLEESLYFDRIELVSQISVTGDIWDIFVRGGIGYIACGSQGLVIVNVTKRFEIEVLDTVSLPNAAFVHVFGDYAYVGNQGSGLYIVDVLDPTDADVVGNAPAGDRIFACISDGEFAYCCDDGDGLRIYNVTDKTNPESVSVFTTSDASGLAYDVKKRNDIVYFTDRVGGIYILNVSSVTNPQMLGSLSFTNSYAWCLDIDKNEEFMYVASQYGFYIVNITNKTSPSLVIFMDISDDRMIDVVLVENYVLLSDDIGGIKIVDVGDVTNPQLVHNTGSFGGRIWHTVVENNLIYVVSYNFKWMKVFQYGDLRITQNNASENFMCGNYSITVIANDTQKSSNHDAFIIRVKKNCSHHGLCYDNMNNCSCHTGGYYGSDCQWWDCNVLRHDNFYSCEYGDCVDASKCICDDGFILDGNMCNLTHCNGKWSNDSSVCSSHGECISYCNCSVGYNSSNCEQWYCFGVEKQNEEVCSSHGVCDSPNNCSCSDPEIYNGSYCQFWSCNNVPVNHFQEVCGSHGKCIDIDNCTCFENYTLGESGDCTIWKCYGLYNNDSNVCSSHGNCSSHNNCTCSENYNSTDCSSFYCNGIEKDSSKVCSSHGTCLIHDVCYCPNPIYSGKFCHEWGCYNESWFDINKVCFGHGVCYAKDVCICQFGYESSTTEYGPCDYWYCDGVGKDQTGSVCSGRGSCTSPETCECVHDFEGTSCTSWSCGVDYKLDLTCNGNGKCIAPKKCDCNFGFTGKFCDEFCSNGEFGDFIKEFRKKNGEGYPIEGKFRIFHEICSAVEYLHSRNIIHRDIKTENVLIDEIEHAKLMDFGLSKLVDRMSVQKTKRIGTGMYMAPEVINQESNYSEKCDVFSMAILMFIIITENFQPYGESEFKLEFKVAGSPSYRPNLEDLEKELNDDDEWIVDVIDKCWSHEGEERYSFQELGELFKAESENMGKKRTDINAHDTRSSLVVKSSGIGGKLKKKKFETSESELISLKGRLNFAMDGNEKLKEDFEERFEKQRKNMELMRKENERLKERMEKQKEDLEMMKEENQKLKTENEELKKMQKKE